MFHCEECEYRSLKPTIQEELLLMSLGEFQMLLRELLEILLNLFNFLVGHGFLIEGEVARKVVVFLNLRTGIIRCSFYTTKGYK